MMLEESNHYIYVEYLNSSGRFINGWLRKEDAEPVKN